MNNKNKKYSISLLLIFAAIAATLFFMPKKTQNSNQKPLHQILSTGQSLSVGAAGDPALTTVQPYNNKMLDVLNRKLVPLVEPSNTLQLMGGETIGSAMANRLSQINGSDFETVVTNHGFGGYSYNQLKKGSSPYNDVGMVQLKAVNQIAAELGRKHEVIGVTVIHGENDNSDISRYWDDWQQKGYLKQEDVYKDYLIEWQRDYENDVRAVTGQEGIVPMFTDQMSSGAPSISALGQLAASEENPGRIILVGPKYFLNYSDIYHLDNYSYRLLGEYYGKVVDLVFNKKQQWKPLSPESIIRNGRVIDVKFYLPIGATNIEFDTDLVDASENMGFRYNSSNIKISIKKVEIVGNDTVRITLNALPSRTDKEKLSYAFYNENDTLGNPNPGAHSQGSARGNLRDNDQSVSAYDPSVKLYNWAVQFSKPIELAK